MAKETEDQAASRMNATLNYPITPQLPAGSACVGRVRRAGRRGKRRDEGVALVSADERALVAEFIRLMRSNYWLSHFVKNLLRLDAANRELVSLESVEEQLKQQKDLEELIGRVQFIGKLGWWRDHPAVNAVAQEWDDVYEYKGDWKIRQLIESAKRARVK